MPNHPLWRELRDAIVRYGGSLARLVKDICDLAFRASRLALAAQLTSRAGAAIPGTVRHRPALIPALEPPRRHARGRSRSAPLFRFVPGGDYSSSR